jgi:WD40-like Beta Propeller Repeat
MNERFSVRRLSVAGTLAVAALIALLATAVASAMHFTAWAPLQAVEPGGTNLVNTAAHDGCPMESPDGLTLYIASNRAGTLGGLDIWVATRASTDAPWGAPENLGAPVNSSADDFCPTSVRGKGLYFVSRRADAGHCGLGDIYFSRDNPAHGWTQPQRLACAPAGPNSELDEQGPSYVEADGEAFLYFSRSRAPAQGTPVPGDIFVSETAGGDFGPATAVIELNGAGNEIQPNVRKDGREVVFSSNRAGGAGSQDIWASTRASIDDAWSEPVNLGSNVNSADSETRPSLSWDAKTLYVGITPPAGPPGDVYVSTREKE